MFDEEVSEKAYELTNLRTKAQKMASDAAQFVAQIDYLIEMENAEED